VIFEAVRRADPARMVLDSVSGLRLLSQSALRYRRQILALKQALARQGCTTLLLGDLTSMDPREDRQLESLSHGVVALRRSEPAYGPDQRRLSVRKLRGSDFAGGAHDYAIETGGLVAFPRLLAGGGSQAFRREPIPCGVAGGGLDRGTSTLLIGPAGAGNSTLALTYPHAVARGGETLRCSSLTKPWDSTKPRPLRWAGTFRIRPRGGRLRCAR
jgi:circadian clock protein KaiC